ncbi:MAG: hypothetical protein QCI82_07950 [Candidatus Thermoplasmatota archaeon]|nr:hypothetical protein [Candidatus Thermoplasmatota archaeon]
MRYVWVLAAVITTMVLASGISTSKSHENYDDAEMDMSTLEYFLRDALDMLKLSVEYGASEDITNCSFYTGAFANRVLNALSTLEGIPVYVDSREYLERHVNIMIYAERNLSLSVEHWTNLTTYMMWLSTLSSSNWTRASLEENLTRLDIAVPGSKESLRFMLDSLTLLQDNLLAISDIDLEITLIDLSRWSENTRSGSGDDLNYSDHLHVFFEPMMRNYSHAIDNVTMGADPGIALKEMADILGSASSSTSSELRSLMEGFTVNVIDSHSTLLGIRRDQIYFEHHLASLKTEIEFGSSILEQYSRSRNAMEHLVLMEEGLTSLYEAYPMLRDHDDGDVISSIDALADLIASYRSDLEDVKLVFSDIGELSSLLEEVLKDNSIDADRDGDGVISLSEASGMELPEGIMSSLERASSMLENISSVLERMDAYTASRYQGPYEALATLYRESLSFSVNHAGFVQNIAELLSSDPSTRSINEEGDRLMAMDAAERLNSMHLSLDGISDATEEGTSYGLDDRSSLISDLEHLLDMYDELMLVVLFEMEFEEGLFISLNRYDAPYDSIVRIGVLVIERTLDGHLAFPQKARVAISLDDTALSTIESIEGRGRYDLLVDRGLSLGAHTINTSCELDGGPYLYNNISFNIRKLRTYIDHHPYEPLVQPGEHIEVELHLRDELSRSVPGNLSISGASHSVFGPLILNISYQQPGQMEVELEYPGDPYQDPSNSTILIEVSYVPIIHLQVSGSVFKIGDDISLNVSCILGEGQLMMLLPSSPMIIGGAWNRSITPYLLNSSILGIGTHALDVTLISNVQWCRNGSSDPIWITVMSEEDHRKYIEANKPPPPIIPEDPPVDDPEDPPINDQDPTGDIDPVETKDRAIPPILFAIIVALLIIIGLSFLAVIVVRRRRKEHAADIYEDAAITRIPGPKEQRSIDGPNSISPLRKGKNELIHSFIDTIESSPPQANMDMHMTMREVSHRLRELRAPEEPERVMFDLERGIYSKTPYDDERSYGVISKLKAIGSWLRTAFRGSEHPSRMGGNGR